MDFRFSKAKFAFVADHVCTNQEFLGNWKNKKSPFIPQVFLLLIILFSLFLLLIVILTLVAGVFYGF